MANELASNPAGLPDRELLARAFDLSAPLTGGDVEGALSLLDGWLRPLKLAEPVAMVRDERADLGFRFEGDGTARLVDALRPLGMKVNPTMEPRQVGGWLAAMVAALSDLPSRVVVRAAQDAIHTPVRFLNEIEGVVRERAEPIHSRYRVARLRLEAFRREMARAATPALPPPEPMSEADLQAMPEPLRKVGLAAGWIEQDADGRISWK